MSAFSDEARAAAVDAQLEALLPQGAEDTLQRLEHSASCSQERAERVRSRPAAWLARFVQHEALMRLRRSAASGLASAAGRRGSSLCWQRG